MADIRCQSSLAGIQAVRRLGIDERNLIPVRMRMHAANERSMNILGTAILRFGGCNMDGQERQTRQIVYVTDDTNNAYLSREGCVALGLISDSFPKIGEAGGLHHTGNSTPEGGQADHVDGECQCPTRQRPPARPERLPFPGTEENRERLQQWLIEHYRSSTFNTCEHQTLPMMDGPPLRLMVDDDATPVACHKAIQVPIHCGMRLKAISTAMFASGSSNPSLLGSR